MLFLVVITVSAYVGNLHPKSMVLCNKLAVGIHYDLVRNIIYQYQAGIYPTKYVLEMQHCPHRTHRRTAPQKYG